MALSQSNTANHPSNNPLLLAVAWTVVALPLAWGVYNTVKTSAKLFQGAAPATASAPADPAASSPASTETKAEH